MGLTDNQERVWAYVANKLGKREYPTLDEIKNDVGLAKRYTEHAVAALETAGLLKRNIRKLRRLEFTDMGLDEATRRGFLPRTAKEERAQIADYIEFWACLPAIAEDLRMEEHCDPSVVARIEAEKAKVSDAG